MRRLISALNCCRAGSYEACCLIVATLLSILPPYYLTFAVWKYIDPSVMTNYIHNEERRKKERKKNNNFEIYKMHVNGLLQSPPHPPPPHSFFPLAVNLVPSLSRMVAHDARLI